MRISDWSSDVCSSDLCATWHTSTSGKTSLTMRHQLTGNVGLYHVARELSRRGWHVMPTVRNARGADLYAASDDEARVLPIQSKALSKRAPVPLGGSLDRLCSHWWVVTIHANTASPTCFVLTLGEVKAAANLGVNQAGTASYWLQPKRSEEHTSELQSLMRISYAVFCLKKKKHK